MLLNMREMLAEGLGKMAKWTTLLGALENGQGPNCITAKGVVAFLVNDAKANKRGCSSASDDPVTGGIRIRGVRCSAIDVE